MSAAGSSAGVPDAGPSGDVPGDVASDVSEDVSAEGGSARLSGRRSGSPSDASSDALSNALSDGELLAAHVAGDPTAFSTLVARHRDRLWAVALRTTGHPEEAADALQDALVSAFRRADSFRGQSSVTTWLHRVVVNACLDRIRHQKVRHAQPLPDDVDRSPVTPVGVTGSPDPEEAAVRADRRRLVLAALAQLTPEHRAALVLVDMEGYPVAEAAEVLGWPVGTVKSRCARGRARLRALLAEAGLEVPGNPGASTPVPSPGASTDISTTTAEGGRP